MPTFTILIPTRNRASLLRLAIDSALAQDFDDVEIVVSDNASTDDTREVVQAHGDAVRLVTTPTSMAMADHWEWASQHAQGDYVLMLCDDDALSPDALTLVNQQIVASGHDVIGIGHGTYFYPEWSEEESRNVAVVPTSSGVHVFDSQQMLARIMRTLDFWKAPRMNNSFCRRSVMEDIRRRTGSFFSGPAPDFVAMTLLLETCQEYAFLDTPLLLFGISPASIGSAAMHDRGDALTEFLAEESTAVFELTPLPIMVPTCGVVESILRVEASLGADPADVPFSWPAVYLRVRDEVRSLQANGVDVSADQQLLHRYWKDQDAGFRTRFRLQEARRWLASSPAGPLVRAARSRAGGMTADLQSGGEGRFRGEATGFSNIAEAAALLPKLRAGR